MSNRVAFVTGSSPGIGRAIALTLCREGFYIVVASPEVENNELVAGEIRAAGGEAMTLNLDISSQESVKEGFAQVLAAKERVAVFAWQQARPGMMKSRWGRIVNMASVVGQAGSPGQANYVASKAALIGLTKALAQEMGSRGITVNAVAPGYIETDMTRVLPEAVKQKYLASIPLGRAGTMADVAAAVKFLVSDDASYITGHVLAVNGGMYM